MTESYIQAITTAYPNLTIEQVQMNEDGQNSVVLIINDTLIFRFPRYDAAGLQREAAVLDFIGPMTTLPTPQPLYKHFGNMAFLGYTYLLGSPLWRADFLAITDQNTLDRMAAQLAGFLRELHSLQPPDSVAHLLPLEDTQAEQTRLYNNIREKLFGYMRPDAQRNITLHFESFLEDTTNFAHLPALRHGDFGTGNILHESGRITGIVDFSSTALGDPAYDFAGLLACYGEAFLARCGKTYPMDEVFLRRVRFYRGTFALVEALFGLQHDDQAAFQAGITDYQ